MVVFYDLVWFGGEEGKSFQDLGFGLEGVFEEFGLFGGWAVPTFPQAGEAKQGADGVGEMKGLAASGGILGSIPFVKAGGGDEAAAGFPGVAESGLGGGGFAAGVDELAADLFILRPMGDEAPAHGAQFGAAILAHDDGGIFLGPNDGARGEFVRATINAQHLGQFHRIHSFGVAAAHGEKVERRSENVKGGGLGREPKSEG